MASDCAAVNVVALGKLRATGRAQELEHRLQEMVSEQESLRLALRAVPDRVVHRPSPSASPDPLASGKAVGSGQSPAEVPRLASERVSPANAYRPPMDEL